MKTMLTIRELSTFIQKDEFVLKTQRQISKDFHFCGVRFSDFFDRDVLSTERILSEIQAALTEIMESNDLSQLLYQIDICQETYVSLLNEPDFLLQLSDLILRREAYKVYLKSLYSH